MPRTKPHTKIHISVAHHPKTQDVWADPAQRGMLVEIWRLAMERYAGKRGDILSLRPLDRLSIAGELEQSRADLLVSVLLRTLKYRLRKYPNRWDVHIRNFSNKHGFTPEESTPVHVPTSDMNGTHKKEERRKKRKERREKREEPDANASDSPASRARLVWPVLVSRAAKHGARWAPKPGSKQVEIVAARIADGATEVDLERAVEGYIRKHGTEERDGFDPMKHFTATTLFRASKFDANVEGSYLPDPTRKRTGGAQSRDAREVMAEARRRQAEQDAKDRPAESPQAVANVIEMGLRNAEAES